MIPERVLPSGLIMQTLDERRARETDSGWGIPGRAPREEPSKTVYVTLARPTGLAALGWSGLVGEIDAQLKPFTVASFTSVQPDACLWVLLVATSRVVQLQGDLIEALDVKGTSVIWSEAIPRTLHPRPKADRA